MPFAFLAPVFLAGLAALAVPFLIHLSSRPRRKTVEFPSLMFLERVEYRDSSKRWLRHIVLFTLRSLALVLVAAAFARPFLDRPDAPATAPDGGREVVVLMDRSASMAVGDRMERARQAVASVAAGLNRGDRATLVLFDHGAAAANRATDQAALLRAAADSVRPGDGATRFGPALRLAESILSGSPLPRRELVVVSDFQRTGWDPAAATRMPAGTEVRMLPVGEPVANTFVADVRFGRERFSGRERVRVAAVVAHRPAGEEAQAGAGIAAGSGPVDVPVQLVMDGRIIATRTTSIPVSGAATVQFDPVTLPDHAVRGVIRAGTDALQADNSFHFTLNAGRALRVLVVEPRQAGGATGGQAGADAPFLVRALAVSPDHDVTEVPADRLGATPLADVDVVVLNGAEPGDPDRIRDYVRAGGGLVVVLGERSRGRTWAGNGLLPGSLQGTRDAAGGAALTALRPEHPVFRAFRSGNEGLTAARFYRYRQLDVEAGQVLARYDGGAPALVVHELGGGRVATLTAPLDGQWSDLVLQPAFVPLAHELVRWVGAREPGPAWRTVGDLLEAGDLLAAGGPPREGDDAGETSGSDATRSSRSIEDRPVILTPADVPVPLDRGTLVTLKQRGFYEVRDPRAGAAVPVAVNGDPAESELAMLDPAVVDAAVSGGEPAVVASFAPEDRERRQALWWFFLAGAFVLMAAETMLSNGLSRKPLPALKEDEA